MLNKTHKAIHLTTETRMFVIKWQKAGFYDLWQEGTQNSFMILLPAPFQFPDLNFSYSITQVMLLTWTVDSLTISIWQGRGICGPWVLAAGSTLAAGGLGQTAGGAGRGGFKWRTTSPYPQFGLILLSILFILWWRRARKYIYFSKVLKR